MQYGGRNRRRKRNSCSGVSREFTINMEASCLVPVNRSAKPVRQRGRFNVSLDSNDLSACEMNFIPFPHLSYITYTEISAPINHNYLGTQIGT